MDRNVLLRKAICDCCGDSAEHLDQHMLTKYDDNKKMYDYFCSLNCLDHLLYNNIMNVENIEKITIEISKEMVKSLKERKGIDRL